MIMKRLIHTLRLWTELNCNKRVKYLRDNNIFGHIGNNVTIMDHKIPLYAKLIKTHNNVHIASNVTFITHDITHDMLNRCSANIKRCNENVGCIEIMDNVFIGTNVTILNNVRISSNAIVATGTVVTKDVPANSVEGGQTWLFAGWMSI